MYIACRENSGEERKGQKEGSDLLLLIHCNNIIIMIMYMYSGKFLRGLIFTDRHFATFHGFNFCGHTHCICVCHCVLA